MPICIECSYPVSHLYSTYSRADDRSLGKGVRLTQCPRCKRFADKYVEYDYVVVFIDLVLIKPQVYRHLLFNRLGRDDDKYDRSIIRLGILLLLFDVYLTWARIERSPSISATFLSDTPIIVQYLFFLSLNALSTVAHHITVRLLASILVPSCHRSNSTGSNIGGNGDNNTGSSGCGSSTELSVPSTPFSPLFVSLSSSSVNIQVPEQQSSGSGSPRLTPNGSHHEMNNNPGGTSSGPDTSLETGHGSDTSSISNPTILPPQRRSSALQTLPPPAPASPTAISTALLISSFPKLFPLLLVIWGPDGTSRIPKSGSHEVSSSILSPALGQNAAYSIPLPSTSSAASSISGCSSSQSSFYDWVTRTSASYLGDSQELIASLLSLGAADTHLVLLNNIEALYILLGCGYMRATMLAVAGHLTRWLVQKAVLSMIGFS
ncbi:sterol homeostasis protein [Monascus purpureus]|uniref:Protein ARV n=1 Tax=Monascus purpureus TaxID=5098 RepID=A0A507QN52_MONPU|nr:sterol homeostasis protein [Monascus purpureus]BDD56149.1 hypothetical protein MAP00_001623 [Monascus purpureus]